MVDQAKQHKEIGLIGGVEKRVIEVVPYDAEWPRRFARHRQMIAAALGSSALAIEHIGSTAVPELAAKPIIDIVVCVADPSDEDCYLPQLEACGYRLRVREPDFDEHRMLRTPERDTHIHVFAAASDEVRKYLAFRGVLRADAAARAAYAALKTELACRDWSDMNAYAAAKGDFIARTIARL